MNNMLEKDLNPPDEVEPTYSDLVEMFLKEVRFTSEEKLIPEMEKLIRRAAKMSRGFDKSVYLEAIEIAFTFGKVSPIIWLIRNEYVGLMDIKCSGMWDNRFPPRDFCEFTIWLVVNSRRK
jgi:hypothetical protein